MSVEDILQEREKTHGSYRTHAAITQSLKNNMVRSPRFVDLSDSQKETLDMIAHKIGRILAGNPNHKDHWDDIAGYATLVSKQLEGEK